MRFFLECRKPDGSWHTIAKSEHADTLDQIQKMVELAADAAEVCIETRQNGRGEFLVRTHPRGIADDLIFRTLARANEIAQSHSKSHGKYGGVGHEVRDQTDGGDYRVSFFEGESR